MPSSVDEILWKLAARAGSAFRIARTDCWILENSEPEVVEVLGHFSVALQRLGERLLIIFFALL